MANLIPTHERILLEKERRFRLVTILVYGFVLTCIIGVILIAPTLILSFSEAGGIQERLTTTQKLIQVHTNEGSIAEINAIDRKRASLEETLTYKTPTTLLSDIIPRMPVGVTVDRITYTREADTAITMTLRGTAQTREALLQFSENMQTSPYFSHVDLPIAQLAKRVNVTFTLTLTTRASTTPESLPTENTL